MSSFTEMKENSLITFTDKNIVNDFKKAFKDAKRLPGMVNVVDPQYRVELGSEAYFLWLNEADGMIMNVEETHTLHIISESSTAKIRNVTTIKPKLEIRSTNRLISLFM
ncbi:hypothetical protein BEP19_09270 [Ammoniphilus oxalaticus]|uniref:YhfM-like domain-containing protein n=2 Tax=Ammoniphilus oxalaticus TaxID=66863 RepID=A0A419SKS8_9BACL|nr:hypothetical protein BEP19_09270 [Ammoniphilus oxalaticus]